VSRVLGCGNSERIGSTLAFFGQSESEEEAFLEDVARVAIAAEDRKHRLPPVGSCLTATVSSGEMTAPR
jgi:hypothetical protein